MKRIFLIGYMGAGKTTIGRDLSQLAGLSFIDLDYYIEGRFHNSISRIFAEHGEAAFREIERKMLHEVAEFEDVLISTGGGTPCFFDNMAFMNSQGTTIYLKVPVEVLANRLESSRNPRPVLKGRTGEELRSFISESLGQRLPFYEQASLVIDAAALDSKAEVRAVSRQIMDHF